MQIAFKKVVKEGLDFSLHINDLDFSGKVYAKTGNLVSCKGNIKGKTSHICDRCGENINLFIDENIDILLSNGVYKNSNELDQADVIEFYNEIIDFDEILDSELESIKSDYHYCEKCINTKE